jgi:hypothetical protein
MKCPLWLKPRHWLRHSRKQWEIALLQLVVRIARGRNVPRASFISRRDNNQLWTIHEQVEGIIRRMQEDYASLRAEPEAVPIELLRPVLHFTPEQYNDVWQRIRHQHTFFTMNAQEARKHVIEASYGKPIPEALSPSTEKLFQRALAEKQFRLRILIERCEGDLFADLAYFNYHGYKVKVGRHSIVVKW